MKPTKRNKKEPIFALLSDPPAENSRRNNNVAMHHDGKEKQDAKRDYGFDDSDFEDVFNKAMRQRDWKTIGNIGRMLSTQEGKYTRDFGAFLMRAAEYHGGTVTLPCNDGNRIGLDLTCLYTEVFTPRSSNKGSKKRKKPGYNPVSASK